MAKKTVAASLFVTCQFCLGTGKEPVDNADGTPTEDKQDCSQCHGTGGNEIGWIEIPTKVLADPA